jgi:tRNA-2-methylthio-N6-dimethylallyladenosine synthase
MYLAPSEDTIKTDTPDDADIILYNTCSVRENAQEKVFHDLGRIKHLKQQNPNLLIGVGGCVASQEGESDHQAGPLRRCRVSARRRCTGCRTCWRQSTCQRSGRRWTFPFPKLRKFDALPTGQAWKVRSAFVSIMEGCSKYCTFCVVPYTRGEEVSRPLP